MTGPAHIVIGGTMKRIIYCLAVSMLATPACLLAQSSDSSSSMQTPSEPPAVKLARLNNATEPAPFSRLALEGGIGVGGINMQVAVEANRYLNIRGIGNYFGYTVNNIKVGGSGSSGSDVSGKLNFAEGGVAVDYYPFPNHGWRLSPGMTFYNENGIAATGVIATGNSITLGSTKYYSDATSNMNLNASLGLNTHKQAFTMTTGWGNMISRRGGHLSFPVEVGAIFTGVPNIGLNITGYGCTNSEDATDNGESCVNMATNTSAQANLQSQITKYQSDLKPLKVYPILSFGVAYNFAIH
jgi:hypothetical protein